MAGHKTTTLLLTWSLYHIARNPKIERSLGKSYPQLLGWYLLVISSLLALKGKRSAYFAEAGQSEHHHCQNFCNFCFNFRFAPFWPLRTEVMSSISLKQLSARRMSYAISSIFRGAQKGSKVIQLDTQHRFIRGKSLLSYDRLVPKLWRVETLKLPFRCLQNIWMLKKMPRSLRVIWTEYQKGMTSGVGWPILVAKIFCWGRFFGSRKLKYMDMVVRETLRLCSPVQVGVLSILLPEVFFFSKFWATCAGGSAWFDAAGAMWEVYAVTRWTQWKRRVKELALWSNILLIARGWMEAAWTPCQHICKFFFGALKPGWQTSSKMVWRGCTFFAAK